MEPRTAIHMILSLIPGGMLLVGPDCSSWSVVSRGSSWRTVMNWHGNMTQQFVVRANLMIARLLVCNIETSSSGLKHLLGGAWPLQADFDLSISAMCGMPLRVRATIGFREGICETYQIWEVLQSCSFCSLATPYCFFSESVRILANRYIYICVFDSCVLGVQAEIPHAALWSSISKTDYLLGQWRAHSGRSWLELKLSDVCRILWDIQTDIPVHPSFYKDIGRLTKKKRERLTTVKTTRSLICIWTCISSGKNIGISKVACAKQYMHTWNFQLEKVNTSGRYVSKSGKTRFNGTADLRATQHVA